MTKQELIENRNKLREAIKLIDEVLLRLPGTGISQVDLYNVPTKINSAISEFNRVIGALTND